MNANNPMPDKIWNNDEPPMPDPLRMSMAMDRIMHTHSIMLMIKKLIWGMLVLVQTLGIIGAVFIMFQADSLSWKLLCLGFALICHEGMVIVMIWIFLTSLRMDMLKELKSMELHLAEFRTHMHGKIGAE